jgi:hypothetical protein
LRFFNQLGALHAPFALVINITIHGELLRNDIYLSEAIKATQLQPVGTDAVTAIRSSLSTILKDNEARLDTFNRPTLDINSSSVYQSTGEDLGQLTPQQYS